MNPTQPTTDLIIGDTTYKLLADFESIAEAEDILDRALITGLRRKDVDHPKINQTRAMFFACAHSMHPELTYEVAKTLVTRKNLSDVWLKVLAAWILGSAEPEEAPESADPKQDQR